jgi:GNAT superfamily N-acetyltransferase
MVTSFVMGTRALYEWAHEHPALEMRASDYANDPVVIARNDNMISINSALAVDLTGQVASDTIMGKFFSGIGGQVDFVRGAARSKGGKAIIALPSTAKNGTLSRIQAAFEAGAGVVTSRGDVRYVVTEYGIADLWGKSIRERAVALIEIAHPDFRAELLAGAKQRHFVFGDQKISTAVYPWKDARTERLLGGAELTVRPARVTDEEALQRLFYELSEASIQQKFLSAKRVHTHEEMQALLDVDYQARLALVACAPGTDEIIAFARYEVDASTALARTEFVVRDDWQGRGVGTLLLRRMGRDRPQRRPQGLLRRRTCHQREHAARLPPERAVSAQSAGGRCRPRRSLLRVEHGSFGPSAGSRPRIAARATRAVRASPASGLATQATRSSALRPCPSPRFSGRTYAHAKFPTLYCVLAESTRSTARSSRCSRTCRSIRRLRGGESCEGS